MCIWSALAKQGLHGIDTGLQVLPAAVEILKGVGVLVEQCLYTLLCVPNGGLTAVGQAIDQVAGLEDGGQCGYLIICGFAKHG